MNDTHESLMGMAMSRTGAGEHQEWTMLDATILVAAERKNQDKKWGEQNHDDLTWLAILTEELGEVSKAVLHTKFGGEEAGREEPELVQVAAVAMAWLESMIRRNALSAEK